ncbi:MAG: hypothetical protein OK474_08770 [Thaumarchaeota archaeon]|nr:hypothetical protein [Nitrososphaerota archaeon]
MRVIDPGRSLEFHARSLGLEEVRRGDMARHGRGRWILLRDRESGQQLELNWHPGGSEFDGPYSPGEGLDHIGFEVSEVFRSHAELVAMGARPALVTPRSTRDGTPR